jgi:hypothetical protein
VPRGCAVAIFAALCLFGTLLVLLALGFIILNETQVDLARLARASRAIRADDPSAPPKALVSLTGNLAADSALGDDAFLAPGAYLQVERIVEMSVWQEYKDHEDSNGKPVYERRQIWSRSTSGLGHVHNPEMLLKGATITAEAARIGDIQIDPRAADLPLRHKLELRKELLLAPAQGTTQDDWLYVGKGTPRRPQIGDLRIAYAVVPSNQLVTVFGSLEGSRMVAYQAQDGRAILRVIEGDRQAALQELGAVQVIAGWIIRLCAAAATWFGLLLLFYASRRLFAWPRALGISTGSARLAAAVGLPLVAIAIASLLASAGNMLALAASLGAAALLAAALLVWRRARITARP